jgi:hypothetical protein
MPQQLEVSQWWLDNDIWLDLLRPLFHEDSSQADRAAKLFYRLLGEIESGEEGVTHAAICIENALRLTFPFTDTYRACEIFFQVSLGENFPPNLDSIALLTEAMKRTKAALERASKSQPKRRRKSSRRE